MRFDFAHSGPLTDDEIDRIEAEVNAVIRQNLFISLGTVVVLVTLAMLGKIPLTVGVVGHEGSTVVVVMNSLRLLFGGSGKRS